MGMSYQTSIVAAIVALVFVMAAIVFGMGIAGRIDANSTPLIVTVFGTIAMVVTSLLSVIRADRIVVEQKKTNGDVKVLKDEMIDVLKNTSPHP